MDKKFVPEPSAKALRLLRNVSDPPPESGPPIYGHPGPASGAVGSKRGVNSDSWGELLPLVADPLITDIFVNDSSGVWVDRGEGLQLDQRISLPSSRIRELAIRLISRGDRHVDEANPCVDVRLHGGVRVHAVLPPISITGALLSIRLPSMKALSVEDLLQAQLFSAPIAERLLAAVAARKNFLISGPGGSGKTTLLGALLSKVSARERIVLMEDVAEIQCVHPHVVSLETRQANLEGAGRITLVDLVRNALRMRPDRLVLGECRGAEVRELLAALNTGHDGGAGTLHANSLADVPSRLEALGALAGMTPAAVARQAYSALNLVVHLERTPAGRRVAAIGTLKLDGERLTIAPSLELPASERASA